MVLMWTNTQRAYKEGRGTLIGGVVTVMAINTPSICQETKREQIKTVMSNTKNIDLAFVHFIWGETWGWWWREDWGSLRPPPIQMSSSCWKPKASIPPSHIVAGKCSMAGGWIRHRERVWGGGSVCMCVRGYKWGLHAHGCIRGVLRHQSCLKKTVLAKWQRPNPAAPPTETLHTHPPLSPLTLPSPINSAFGTFAHKPQNPEPHSHSVTHPCHTSLQIKFTLGPPLSKKPKERQRGNEMEGLTSLPGSRAHDRHLLNPFYTHVSGFYQSSCIPKCKFVLKIKSSFRRKKEFLNCWLWEGLYYPQPWMSGVAIDSPPIPSSLLSAFSLPPTSDSHWLFFCH